MRKKRVYILAMFTLLTIIALVVYFNVSGNTKEVFDGTLVWKGFNI